MVVKGMLKINAANSLECGITHIKIRRSKGWPYVNERCRRERRQLLLKEKVWRKLLFKMEYSISIKIVLDVHGILNIVQENCNRFVAVHNAGESFI